MDEGLALVDGTLRLLGTLDGKLDGTLDGWLDGWFDGWLDGMPLVEGALLVDGNRLGWLLEEGSRLILGSWLGSWLVEGGLEIICDGAELAEGTSDADGVVEGLALGLPVGAAVTSLPPAFL